MKIKIYVIPLIIFAVIFGGVLVTMATGIWSTTSNKVPVTYKDGEYQGEYNPADIRGSYTFEEVSTLFNVDLKVLYQAFGIPEDTDGGQIKTKDLEEMYGNEGVDIGNESVRLFVGLYKNLPIQLEDAFLPKQAVEIIREANPALTAEQDDYLKNHQAEGSPDELSEDNLGTVQESENTQLVKGQTTFQQVLDAGISREMIEQIIGTDLPPTHQTVRDYCTSQELRFSVIKEQLNQIAE